MSLGVQKGDIVSLNMSNNPEYLSLMMGIAKIGAATALINCNLKGLSMIAIMIIILFHLLLFFILFYFFGFVSLLDKKI